MEYIFFYRLRKSLSSWSTLLGFRILARGVSAVVTFHNRENMAKGGGLCVANHTSPIDAILLACDRNYALVCPLLNYLIRRNFGENLIWRYPIFIKFGKDLIWR